MKKQMKLVAILLAALGLMVFENKADAQQLSLGFSVGGPHGYVSGSYDNGYYDRGYCEPRTYQPPVACEPAPVYVAPAPVYVEPAPVYVRPRAYGYGYGRRYEGYYGRRFEGRREGWGRGREGHRRW